MIVGARFSVLRLIGKGAFSSVYLAQDMFTNCLVAIKLEPTTAKKRHLEGELRAYRDLYGIENIPRVIWFGVEGAYSLLVMECLGSSLAQLVESTKLSLKSVLMTGLDILSLLEQIHARGYLHRDIKPANCVVSLDGTRVKLCDFGLSTRYIDPKTLEHVPYRENAAFRGTDRFASINTHQRKEASRRDDLESLGYMLIHLALGYLPWSGISSPCKQTRRKLIEQCKIATPTEQLCMGLPSEFNEYMRYVTKLEFAQAPNYAYMRQLFEKCLDRYQFEHDHLYDWLQVPAESETTSISWAEEDSTVMMRGSAANGYVSMSSDSPCASPAPMMPQQSVWG